MSEATTIEYNPAFQPILIDIKNASENDIEYAHELLQHPDNINQSDLRDNMAIFKYNEKRGLEVILRSAKLKQEYQEWQEEVRALKVEPIEGIEGTINPFERKLDKERKSRTITISKGDVPLLIDIINPQPASKKNDNTSDADYALRILQKGDNETAFILRGNMELRRKSNE